MKETVALLLSMASFAPADARVPTYYIGAGAGRTTLGLASEMEIAPYTFIDAAAPAAFAAPMLYSGVVFLDKYGFEGYYLAPSRRTNHNVVGADSVEGRFEGLGLAAIYWLGGAHGFSAFAGARVSNYRYYATALDDGDRASASEAGFGYGGMVGFAYKAAPGLSLRVSLAADNYDGDWLNNAQNLDGGVFWNF
ncbi:MAG: hypothetical protein LBL52_01915 [Rickettsiales bacterium]|nr:hypothetical protein [Rickettsiales bacterium]